MKIIRKKIYQMPNVLILCINEESHLLLTSPNVRPGAGGEGGQTGRIQVLPGTEVVGDNNDELEG
jgi:hypothetical protein